MISLLDWEYVCDQCPEIQQALEKKAFQSEYGINFFEFINTEEGLYLMAVDWWKNLSPERKKEIVNKRYNELLQYIDRIEILAVAEEIPLKKDS